MRIGMINENPDWGGGEQWFSDASSALAARGHELVLAARAGSPLFERFAASGHPLRTMEQLADGLGDPPPEIVLCNTGRDLRALVNAFGKRPPFRMVLRRGIDRKLHDHPIRRSRWRLLSAILVNSDATAETVRRSLAWFPPDRIRRIYNPVSFEALPPVAADGPAFRFGAAGRLVKQKGFDVLLRALAQVGDDFAWTLEIAGDGKLRPRLERQAEKLGLASAVTFLGHLDSLAPFYARADAIVVPSRYEGFGFVAVEAALCGLPVIASDVSSLREIVVHGESGLLVTVEDATALAAALAELATDRERAKRLGADARGRARRCFDPETLGDELERFLEDAAGLDPVG